MKFFGVLVLAFGCFATSVFATGHGNIWLDRSDYSLACNANGAVITLKSNSRVIYLGKSCDSAIPEANWEGNWSTLDNGDFIVEAPGLIQFRGPLQCDLPAC